MYYVYGYFREDGTPYYIGRGTGYRAWKRARHIAVPTDVARIKILADGMTFEEANEFEIALISLFGRKDNGTGILRNMTDGGEGCRGRKHSAESRAKMSASHKGVKLSARHIAARSEGQKILTRWTHAEHGEAFCSAKDLSEAYGCDSSTLSKVRRGKLKSHHGWRLA